jgi:hypothetical protein
VGAPFQGVQTRVGIDFAMPAEQCYPGPRGCPLGMKEVQRSPRSCDRVRLVSERLSMR